jgi:hypothetical protein
LLELRSIKHWQSCRLVWMSSREAIVRPSLPQPC